MEKKLDLPILGIVIVLIIEIVILGMIFRKEARPLGSADFNRIESGVTHSTANISASVGTATTNAVLSANPGRVYAMICNPSTDEITLQLTSSTSGLVAKKGIVLDAKECYEIKPDNLYIGAIVGIASTSTSTITTIEK